MGAKRPAGRNRNRREDRRGHQPLDDCAGGGPAGTGTSSPAGYGARGEGIGHGDGNGLGPAAFLHRGVHAETSGVAAAWGVARRW